MDSKLQESYFGTVDLIVFIGLLVLAILVGAYYAIKDRKNNDTENYYFGGRKMSPIPVGLSISVTYMSGITVIGYPTEAYGYGSVTLWYAVCAVMPNIVACLYYIPLVHRLTLSSIFEYLERRFHRGIRLLESFITVVIMIIYLGAAIYLPALALNAVTPMSLTWTIITTGVVCIVYTTLGGMKAVVWTDTLQTFIMLSGMLAALVKAIVDVGGTQRVVEALEQGERSNFLNFNPDMTMPYSFWSIVVGGSFMWCQGICVNQSITQRFLSCKSVKHARIASVASMAPTCVFMGLATSTGLVMYAYFEGCDPVMAGTVKKPDQLLPMLVVGVFQSIPGMAGLFVSAAFSGTLSTVSSGINATGALILEDFIMPKWPELKASSKMTVSKAAVAIFGFLSMAYAYCIQYIEATIIQLGFVVIGSLGGPVLGVFTLGIFLPWCTTKGAIAGQAVGTTFQAWVGISSLIYGKPPEKYSFLPTSIDQCPVRSVTNSTIYSSSSESFSVTSSMEQTAAARPIIQDTLFAVSPLYYSMLSFVVTTVVGLVVSLITGPKKPEDMDPDLFVPIIDHPCLPKRVRAFFRFGVPESANKTKWEAGQPVKEKEHEFQFSETSSEIVSRTSAV